jgi:hypothetical protein
MGLLCDFTVCPFGYGGKVAAECATDGGASKPPHYGRDAARLRTGRGEAASKAREAECLATVADMIACSKAMDADPCGPRPTVQTGWMLNTLPLGQQPREGADRGAR